MGDVAQAVFWLARIISKVVGEWVVNPASPPFPIWDTSVEGILPPRVMRNHLWLGDVGREGCFFLGFVFQNGPSL